MYRLIISIYVIISILSYVNCTNINLENTIYVDSSFVGCQGDSNNCDIQLDGSYQYPFNSISDAVNHATRNSISKIILKPGFYTGNKNKDIEIIGSSLEIQSLNRLSNTTIIDCEGAGNAFTLKSSKKVSFIGITIQNCRSNLGGAIHSIDSGLIIKNSQFINNRATRGAAIFVEETVSNTVQNTNILSSIFSRNAALKSGGAIEIIRSDAKLSLVQFQCNYVLGSMKSVDTVDSDAIRNDLSAKENSKITISSTSSVNPEINIDNIATNCDTSSSISDSNSNGRLICQQKGLDYSSCISTSTSSSQKLMMSTFAADAPSSPNCFANSQDSCYFSGVKHEIFEDSVSVSVGPALVMETTIQQWGSTTKSVTGKFSGYIKVKSSGYYRFNSVTQNIGLKIKIDNIYRLNHEQPENNFVSSDYFRLKGSRVHLFVAEYSADVTSTARPFSLKMDFTDLNGNIMNHVIFFSQNMCGDGIYDTYEKTSKTCQSDMNGIVPTAVVTCGNNICDEEPNSCIVDCHDQITIKCPPRYVPKDHLSPGYLVEDDTLGALISDQFLWNLPGSQHLTFGFNLVTGEEASSPIFYFAGDCDEIASTIVDDPYRAMSFSIPSEISAKALPKCEFDSVSNIYKSTNEYRNSLHDASTLDFEIGGSGSWEGISIEASASFSREKSVDQTNTMATSEQHSIIVNKVECSSFMVQLEKITFHPKFLERIASIQTFDDMYHIVEDYGTKFYRRAKLGGTLKQTTTTTQSISSTSDQKEWKEHTSASFSTSVTAPVFSGSGSIRGGKTSEGQYQNDIEKIKSSNRSTVQVYGGIPGAFGPKNTHSSPYTEWAQSLDLLPVPINYTLQPIRTIIPDTWKTREGKKVVDLWKQAEELYYYRNQYKEYRVDENTDKLIDFTLFINTNNTNFPTQIPILSIKWTDPNGKVKQFKSTVPFVKVGLDGTRSPDYSFGGYNQMPMSYALSKQWNIRIMKDLADTYSNGATWTKFFSETQYHRGPYRWDFQAPDFFNSITKPVITLENFDKRDNNICHIISWKDKNGLVFDLNNGVLSNSNTYVLAAFERLWAWDLGITQKRNFRDNANQWKSTCTDPTRYDYIDCFIKKMFDVGNILPRNKMDFIEFGFCSTKASTQAGKVEIVGADIGFTYNAWWDDLQPYYQFIGYNYFSQASPEHKNNFLVRNKNHIGSQTRLDWALVFREVSGADWKRTISSYHVNDNTKPADQQFVEVNLDVSTSFASDPYSDFISHDLVTLTDKHRYNYHTHNYNFDSNSVPNVIAAFNLNAPNGKITFDSSKSIKNPKDSINTY